MMIVYVDLEKRQHEFASGRLHAIMPGPNSDTELRPMAGGWKDADTSAHAKEL